MIISDLVTELSSDLNRVNVYVGSDNKLHFVNGSGADSVIPFNPPICWNSHGYYGYGCALDTSNYRYLEITSHVAIHVFHDDGYTDYAVYAPRYSDAGYGAHTLLAAIAADVTQVIDVSDYETIIFSAQNNAGGSSGMNLNSTIAWGKLYN